jgi:hypothetical protein
VPDRVRCGSDLRQGALQPTLASALYGRGLAKLKKGENASGEADVSAAKAMKPNVAEEFARYGSEEGRAISLVQ